ncbi:MAG: patatin-like phospholipase family protein [Muribaculaceae bacterium]|nr:patatin-like phospholipase family protein [Muribaculaceae bacterium]
MKKTIIILFGALLLCAICYACRKKTHRASNDGPKIGLALGGGGAKAAAEIGVLKFLDEEGIKIDYIAGTSMGALVGGLYAAGYTANEIDSLWRNEDWLSLFDKKAIFSIAGDRSFLGLVKGDVLENNLRRVLAEKGCTRIGDAKIKFRCTASQIIDNNDLKEYVFDSDDDMARAIRASMTYPLGYGPVNYNGMELVDGGMLNNLPVDVVKKMGAEMEEEKVIVIAVDLEMQKHNNKKNINIKLVHWLIDWCLTHSDDINKHNKNWEDADICINPFNDDKISKKFSITSFSEDDANEMMSLGYKGAKINTTKIKALTQKKNRH